MLKKLLKYAVPDSLLRWRNRLVVNRNYRRYADLTTREVFSMVYRSRDWGSSATGGFYSGHGSHDHTVVDPYVRKVGEFLQLLGRNRDVVDLGCGDFAVGSRIRRFCGNYVAGDIVDALIDQNRRKYRGMDVDFRVIDIGQDTLPEGEVVFLRQVLQHLSNNEIGTVLPRICSQYRFLILTEHLPPDDPFTHNIDKPVGPDIRLSLNSGVVITSPPFNIRVQETRVLCEVPAYGGRIRTQLYVLR